MADTNTTPQASAYTALGTARTDKVTLPEATFDGVINVPVMHKAVTAFLANQRQGNASTKIRKYVIGGNQKPWKQKGTGRARQGSTRAPHWVGGGTVFGPIPRSYAQYLSLIHISEPTRLLSISYAVFCLKKKKKKNKNT